MHLPGIFGARLDWFFVEEDPTALQKKALIGVLRKYYSIFTITAVNCFFQSLKHHYVLTTYLLELFTSVSRLPSNLRFVNSRDVEPYSEQIRGNLDINC